MKRGEKLPSTPRSSSSAWRYAAFACDEPALPLLLDQKHVVPFIVDYVAKLDEAEPLQVGRTLLQLGDRILGVAEAGGRATTVTPLLVTIFVESAMSRARDGMALDDLPQDVPDIFLDYLKRIQAGPGTAPSSAAQDQFVDAALVLAELSLGARRVPNDFSIDEARTALGEHATAQLETMIRVSACKIDPLRASSACKIDPPIFGLIGCPLWREAGGGGCLLWRRSGGYDASIWTRESRSRRSRGRCICPATRCVGFCGQARRRFRMNGRSSRGRSSGRGRPRSIRCCL